MSMKTSAKPSSSAMDAQAHPSVHLHGRRPSRRGALSRSQRIIPFWLMSLMIMESAARTLHLKTMAVQEVQQAPGMLGQMAVQEAVFREAAAMTEVEQTREAEPEQGQE